MSTKNDVQEIYIGLLGRAADKPGLDYWVAEVSSGHMTLEEVRANIVNSQPEYLENFGDLSRSQAVNLTYNFLFGRDAETDGLTYWVSGGGAGVSIDQLVFALSNGASPEDRLVLDNRIQAANYYTDTAGAEHFTPESAAASIADVDGTPASVQDSKDATDDYVTGSEVVGFDLVQEDIGGAVGMRITGSMDARIDFTASDNQVKGLDLNQNGIIQNNGVENKNPTSLDDGINFAAVDAYRRDMYNDFNTKENFLGDISFDGSSNGGNGVSTNGNIFLGGLGADTALGGVGNDFLVGGGVAQDRYVYNPATQQWTDIVTGNVDLSMTDSNQGEGFGGYDELFGGRNADFFFAELSLLDNTDGNHLRIDGGNTSDDPRYGWRDTGQDSDWLLLEASDDDEPVDVNLGINTGGNFFNNGPGTVTTNTGQTIQMTEIEHLDASGNLYGFIDGIDVALGGQTDPNAGVGIGTSAQLLVSGSEYSNIIVGGFANDKIQGLGGDDLLFGGNLNFNNNPNLQNITTDGVDEIYGGEGNDDISWAADGGLSDGGSLAEGQAASTPDASEFIPDEGSDTLWLTDLTFGTLSAAEVTSDGYVRIDLAADASGSNAPNQQDGIFNDNPVNDGSAGYGGADRSSSAWGTPTADQTNYVNESSATDITSMENINATGLGAIDYFAAGTNNPELIFNNQQNFLGIADVNLDLRGTYAPGIEKSYGFADGEDCDDDSDHNISVPGNPDRQSGGSTTYYDDNYVWTQQDTDDWLNFNAMRGDNILMAGSGNDNLEGRTGNDILMGGNGDDDFFFSLGSDAGAYRDSGDGLNKIQRAVDANGDNIWDGYDIKTEQGEWGRDFGNQTITIGATSLFVTIKSVAQPLAELGDIVNSVESIVTGVLVEGVFVPVVLDTAEIKAAATYAELLTAVQDALAGLANPDFAVSLTASMIDNKIIINDSQGRELADTIGEGAKVVVSLPAQSDVQTNMAYQLGEDTVARDRIVFASYEDRRDGELRDDDAVINAVGDPVSLGDRNYAEDLVVGFNENGTTLSENQVWCLHFANLAEEDVVTITLNGVVYSAQVGLASDGTSEPTDYDNGDGNFENFLERFARLINAQDDDTLAGSLRVAVIDGDTLVLDQGNYNGGEAVYMNAPEVAIQNKSGGEVAGVQIMETTRTSVFMLDWTEGRDGGLNRDNVLFLGNSGIDQGDVVAPENSRSILETALDAGGDLIGLDAMLVDSDADLDSNPNYSIHGHDLLFTGSGNDNVKGLTGDDRVYASVGTDTVDGGVNYYSTASGAVVMANKYEAALMPGVSLLGMESFTDTLIVQQTDFAANATFTVTLDAGLLAASPSATVLAAGIAGTVVQDGTANVTNFSNFEAVRTISGTLAVQGRDTLNLAAVSDAAIDSTGLPGNANEDAAGVSYGMTAGQVNVSYKSTAGMTNLDYARVDGVENVTTGRGNDIVVIDGSETAKENIINLGGETSHDTVGYDLSNYAFSATTAMTLVVESGVETDTVTFSGPAIKTPATDTLIDVEMLALGDCVGKTDKDVLDVTNIAGAVVGFTDDQYAIENIGKSESGFGAGDPGDAAGVPPTANADQLNGGGISTEAALGVEIIDIWGIEKFDTVQFGGTDDRIIVGDNLEGDMYTFLMGAGNDTADYRLQGSELRVRVATDGSDTDMVFSDWWANVPGNLNPDSTQVLISNETYIAADGDAYSQGDVANNEFWDGNSIDLTTSAIATTIAYSVDDDRVDPDGQALPVVGAGHRAQVRSTDTAVVFANFDEYSTSALNPTGLWDVVFGGAAAETVLLTNAEAAYSQLFDLGAAGVGTTNVVDASAVDALTGPTDLWVESLHSGTGTDNLTHHDFDGDDIRTAANALTVIASLESDADWIDVFDLDEGHSDPTRIKSTVVNLTTGVVVEQLNGADINTINVANFENVDGSSVADEITGNDVANILNGHAGNDTINGGGGDDTIDGGAGDDDIKGGAGVDLILGGFGDDTISGGEGEDNIDGGDGDDMITGDAGDDTILGGLGDDMITGGTGGDLLTGGAGADDFIYVGALDSLSTDPDTISDFVSGTDRIVVTTKDSAFQAGSSGITFANVAGVVTIGVDDDGAGGFVFATAAVPTNPDSQYVINDTSTTAAATDLLVKILQSAGADAQDLSLTSANTSAVYTAQNQSTLGGRDVFANGNIAINHNDFSAFDFLSKKDFNNDASGTLPGDPGVDGVTRDEIMKIQIPVSVDNASTITDFFLSDSLVAANVGKDVLYVLQNEAGTANYRLFVDVNLDGDFTQADDMVIDITNDMNGNPFTVANIESFIDNLDGIDPTVTGTGWDIFLATA